MEKRIQLEILKRDNTRWIWDWMVMIKLKKNEKTIICLIAPPVFFYCIRYIFSFLGNLNGKIRCVPLKDVKFRNKLTKDHLLDI